MKKVFTLFITLLTIQVGAFQTRYSFNLDDCFKGCYKPGVYVGSQLGYAWIQTPTCGAVRVGDNFAIGHKGHFAYGFFGGITLNKICDVFVGLEGGYNDNGYSTILFNNSRNIYRIKSQDWNISATFTYAFCRSFDAFVNIGGARVKEQFKLFRVSDESQAIFKSLRDKSWAPVINTGLGYSIFDWLNVSIAYRGVLSQSHNALRKRFSFVTLEDGSSLYAWHGVSTVHSVLGGLSIRF